VVVVDVVRDSDGYDPVVRWGALEFVARVDDGAAHASMRLIFRSLSSQQHGRTIYAALSHPRAGGG
jgi:hypothetical protein